MIQTIPEQALTELLQAQVAVLTNGRLRPSATQEHGDGASSAGLRMTSDGRVPERRAALLAQRLDEYLKESEAALVRRAGLNGPRVRQARLAAISQTKDAALEGWFDEGWAYDIVSAFAENKPITVWTHDVTPAVRTHAAADLTRPVGTSGFTVEWSASQREGYCLARMLYDISPGNTVRLRFLAERSQLPRTAGVDPIIFIEQFLSIEGLSATGRPRETVDIVSLADYGAEGKDIIDQLKWCGAGEVVMYQRRQLAFRPAPWVREWVRLQWPGAPSADDSEAWHIPLGPSGDYKKGSVTAGYALRAVPLAAAADNMQLVVGNERCALTGGLLRALGTIRRDKLHFIRPPVSDLGEEYAAFHLGHVLRRELQRYRESFSHYATFDEFDADAYRRKNYGEVMEQDKDIIYVQMAAEPEIKAQLGIDLTKPETLLKDFEAVHVCIGSNLYPVMLREHLSGGAILGIDVAPTAITYIDEVKQGKHDARWQAHEDVMVATGQVLNGKGRALHGSIRRAADKLHVIMDDARNLPPRAFRLVEMHFGAEATGLQRTHFYDMLRAIAGSLQDEHAVFEGVFTMESGPWSDSINQLPAVSMSEEDYDLALIDSGFEVIEKRIIGAGLPGHVKVRPDEDFVYYRCRLRGRK